MFTHIRARNFRCFSDLDFDLTGSNGEAKHLVLIYGENGAGKSNLVAVFYCLIELLKTMDMAEAAEGLMRQVQAAGEDKDFARFIRSNMRDLRAVFQSYHMIGSTDPIELQYDFNIDGKKGSYFISFGQKEDEVEILHERLDFALERRRTTYFDLDSERDVLNDRIFRDDDLRADIVSAKKKYWGRHSLLSLLLHEAHTKSPQYVRNGLIPNGWRVLQFFQKLDGSVRLGTKTGRPMMEQKKIFPLDSGMIPASEAPRLDKALRMIKEFFMTINSDIKNAYYQKNETQDSIRYQLYFEKLIAGQVRRVSFARESSGNQEMLGFLFNLVYASAGGIEVLDEMDSGVHDLAAYKILTDLYTGLKGQLILTTHNTLLMDGDFAKEATYILKEDENAQRFIECIADNEERIYQKTNIRRKYIENTYGGVPQIGKLHFEELQKFF